jgi:uncharacterized membrane protein
MVVLILTILDILLDIPMLLVSHSLHLDNICITFAFLLPPPFREEDLVVLDIRSSRALYSIWVFSLNLHSTFYGFVIA